MSTARIVAFLWAISVVASLALTPAIPVAHAQEPGNEGRPRDETSQESSRADEEDKARESESQADVGGDGLIDPTPPGMTMLYMFSGAAHKTAAGGKVATVVHCTNYGTESAQVQVEVFDWSDSDDTTFSGATTLLSNRTKTFVTQLTGVYWDDIVMTQAVADDINQGSGRILSDRTTIICTAQVVDPAHNQPWFAVKLALHYPNGRPVSAYFIGSAKLPVIMRSASPSP
jgi:hypothetical protein